VAVFAITGEDDDLTIKCIRKSDSLEDVLNKM